MTDTTKYGIVAAAIVGAAIVASKSKGLGLADGKKGTFYVSAFWGQGELAERAIKLFDDDPKFFIEEWVIREEHDSIGNMTDKNPCQDYHEVHKLTIKKRKFLVCIDRRHETISVDEIIKR